jgi:hypothetical protein
VWPLKRTDRQVLAWPEGGRYKVVAFLAGEHPHPGTEGTGFLEEALEVASDTLKARLVS